LRRDADARHTRRDHRRLTVNRVCNYFTGQRVPPPRATGQGRS
jgi:hypothetical protein